MEPTRFRDCGCPGTPHPDGDTVTFKEKLSFDENVAALSAIFTGDGEPHTSRALGVYVRSGPVAWNLLDENGKAVPLTAEALAALPFADQYEIGDRADDLYGETVLSPLVERTKQFLKTSQTPDTSRPPSTSSGTRRPRRKRS